MLLCHYYTKQYWYAMSLYMSKQKTNTVLIIISQLLSYNSYEDSFIKLSSSTHGLMLNPALCSSVNVSEFMLPLPMYILGFSVLYWKCNTSLSAQCLQGASLSQRPVIWDGLWFIWMKYNSTCLSVGLLICTFKKKYSSLRVMYITYLTKVSS